MRRRFLFVSILAVFCSLLSIGGLSAQGDKAVIVAGDVKDVITLDPARAYEVTNLTIFHAVYETLINVPADDLTKLDPGLATSWDVSADGLTYTFHLREGVTFSSGNPLTADDVVFSWMRLKNIKGNPSFYMDAVSSVEAVDPLTVKVTLSAPTPAFLSIVSTPATSITDSKVVKANGGTDAADADATDKAEDFLSQNSQGTGPFVLTGWTPNTTVTMVRNDKYWGGPAKLSSVTITEVNDSTTGVQQLQKGDLDIVDNIQKDLADQVKGDSSLKLEIGKSLNLSYIAMTPNEALGGPLAKQEVRQAIAYSIDYDGITNGLLLGYSDRPAAMLPIGVQGSDGSGRYERDVEKAKSLLSSVGLSSVDVTLTLGEGGICGIPGDTIGAKLQADLAEAGINVTVDIQQSSNLLTAYRAQQLPMVMSTWSPDYLDATMWSDYFSTDVGPGHRIMIDDARTNLAELAQTGGAETDTAKRTDIYKQWVQTSKDAAVFVPLCQNQILVATSSKIENFVFHPVYFFDFYAMDKAA